MHKGDPMVIGGVGGRCAQPAGYAEGVTLVRMPEPCAKQVSIFPQ